VQVWQQDRVTHDLLQSILKKIFLKYFIAYNGDIPKIENILTLGRLTVVSHTTEDPPTKGSTWDL
jgi:hypothetical protein